MRPVERELKEATRPVRVAAMVAILGILILSLGGKVIHDVMEARNDAVATDARR